MPLLKLGNLYNLDCMEGMKQFPDKYFELAIVDPPYGIERFKNPKGRFEKYGDTRKGNNEVPDQKYFNELYRISRNQIIWGGNYFGLDMSKGAVIWDKGLYGKTNYADGEMAYTSFKNPLRIAQIRYDGFLGADKDGRINPFQKPIKLYDWLLKKYAKQGDKILDTHVGSASSLIACYNLDYEYIGFELDADFFNLATERLEAVKSQMRLF